MVTKRDVQTLSRIYQKIGLDVSPLAVYTARIYNGIEQWEILEPKAEVDERLDQKYTLMKTFLREGLLELKRARESKAEESKFLN